MESNKIISVDEIKKLASTVEFAIGNEIYLKGKVKNAIRNEKSFMAIIADDDLYDVELDIASGLDFSCDCSHEGEDLCRHEVALGVAIINGLFIEKTDKYIEELHLKLPEDFLKSFGKVKNELKIEFLLQLFSGDVRLRQQFLTYIDNKSKKDSSKINAVNEVDELTESVDKIKSDAQKLYNNIPYDFSISDEEYKYFYHESGFYDEGINMLKAALAPHFDMVNQLFNQGKIKQALKKLLGLYEGAFNLKTPVYNNIEVFYNYTDAIHNVIKSEIRKYADNLSLVVKTDEMVIDAINLFLDRYLNDLGSKKQKQIPKVAYRVKLFSAVIHSLITSPAVASHIIQRIYTLGYDTEEFAEILIDCAELTGEIDLWIEIAEKYAPSVKGVAYPLLGHYKSYKDEENFLRIAKIAFSKWPSELDYYLISTLDKEKHQDLYSEVLTFFTFDKKSKDSYQELKKRLTKEQRKVLLHDAENKWSVGFVVQLMAEEQMYSVILRIVKENEIYMVEEFMSYIWNIYPDECFEVIAQHCNKILMLPKKTKKDVEKLLSNLFLMRKIESKKPQTKSFIEAINNNYNELYTYSVWNSLKV